MLDYPEGIKVKCDCKKIGDIDIRYLLTLEWLIGEGDSVLCIMMNPSKADENESDASVNRVIKFLGNNGYKIIKIANLFPFYQSKSFKLEDTIANFKEEFGEKQLSSIMEANMETIKQEIDSCTKIILAWGDCPGGMNEEFYYKWRREISTYIDFSSANKYIFKTEHRNGEITEAGSPRHPSRNALKGLLKVGFTETYQLKLE